MKCPVETLYIRTEPSWFAADIQVWSWMVSSPSDSLTADGTKWIRVQYEFC